MQHLEVVELRANPIKKPTGNNTLFINDILPISMILVKDDTLTRTVILMKL